MEGRDYFVTLHGHQWCPSFSIVLRLLLAFACTHGFTVTQVDFTGAYLNAKLVGDMPAYTRQLAQQI